MVKEANCAVENIATGIGTQAIATTLTATRRRTPALEM